MLGAFAREELGGFDDADLSHYEDLLDFGDPVIWSWISLQSPVPANIDNPALTRLMTWCRSRS